MDKQILSEKPLVFVIPNFFSKSTCNMLIQEAEKIGFQDAPITLDGSKKIFKMDKSVRNNTRVISIDIKLANHLTNIFKDYLPQEFNGWKLKGLNECFRYYKYEEGQTFKPHIDGAYKPSNTLQSKLTFLIYLSDVEEGGSTSFFKDTEDELRFQVNPSVGSVLIFDHKQLHSGDSIDKGVKYVLRTDVMYEKTI